MPEGVDDEIDKSVEEVSSPYRRKEAMLGAEDDRAFMYYMINKWYRDNQKGINAPSQSQDAQAAPVTPSRPSNVGASDNSGVPTPPNRDDMEAARNGAQVQTAEGEASIEDEASSLSPWWLALLGARALVPGQRTMPPGTTGEEVSAETPRQLEGPSSRELEQSARRNVAGAAPNLDDFVDAEFRDVTPGRQIDAMIDETMMLERPDNARSVSGSADQAAQIEGPRQQITDQRPQENRDGVPRADGNVIEGEGQVANPREMLADFERYQNGNSVTRRQIARQFRQRYGMTIQDARAYFQQNRPNAGRVQAPTRPSRSPVR